MRARVNARRHLDRHLDADEAVVLGAGLFAANMSSSFRLRVIAGGGGGLVLWS
jgi:hypoxia up-regulated 1